MPPDPLCVDRVASPIGAIELVFDDAGVLRALDFEDHEERMLQLLRLHYGAINLQTQTAPQGITKALEAYFAGDLEALGSIRWATAGTPFQRTVWTALTTALADLHVWRARRAPRQTKRATRRWSRQWRQSGRNRNSLSPRHWRGRQADGLWRRPASKALVARTRRRDFHAGIRRRPVFLTAQSGNRIRASNFTPRRSACKGAVSQ
jgi:6-O-methylguanine DNA methyltransferase, ribonuclease-like domain